MTGRRRRSERPLPDVVSPVSETSPQIPHQSQMDASAVEFVQSDEAIAEDKRLRTNEYARQRYAKHKAAVQATRNEARRSQSTPVRSARQLDHHQARSRRMESLSEADRVVSADEQRRRSAMRRVLENTPQRNARRKRDRLAHARVHIPSLNQLLDEVPFGTIGKATPAVLKCVENFHAEMASITTTECPACNERFPGMQFVKSTGLCRPCHSDKRTPKKFSAENNMQPGEDVPDVLARLSPIEEMLIAQIGCIMSVHRLPGGQLGYSGNVINFSQDVKGFVKALPRLPKELEVIVVKRGNASGSKLYRVRRSFVEEALVWLCEHNPFYHNAQILPQNLALLPTDGYIDDELRSIEDGAELIEHRDMGPVNAAQEELVTSDADQPQGFVLNAASRLNEDEAIHAQVQSGTSDTVTQWPHIDGTPINEYTHEGYDVCAFPCLFPYGSGSLRSPRLVKITPAEYGLHLMRYKDGRFRKHARFRFFLFNSIQRWRATTQGSLFLNYRSPEDRNLSAAEFKAKYAHDSVELCRRILHFGKTLRGTPQFWMNERANLLEMINQRGCPTLFWTLSAADLYWPEFHRLLPRGVPDDCLTEAEKYRLRQENLVNDPDTASWLFHHRITLFVKKVLMVLFDVEDFWFRYEWQARGSPHGHGFFWIKKAPSIDNIQHMSAEGKQEIANWFDSIVTTWNEALGQPVADVNPCTLPYSGIGEREDDYHNLTNMIERHARCVVGYCLRRKRIGGQFACRFEFPKALRDDTVLKVACNGRIKLASRRNDPLLNSHNKVLLQAWRANVDLSALTDPVDVAQYAAKYSSKPEPRSKPFSQLCEQIINDLKDTESHRSTAAKLLMKSVGERDYTAQEVCHHLHGLPLVQCSRSFVKVFLFPENNLRRIQKPKGQQNPNEEEATENDHLRKYMQRGICLEAFTFRQLLTDFAWSRKAKDWDRKSNGNSNIVVVIPALAPDTSSESYCRQRMLLDVPFRRTSELLAGCDSSWVDAFALSLLLPVRRHVVDCDEDSEDEYEPPEVREHERLGWMIAGDTGPDWDCCETEATDLGKRPLDLEFQWDSSWVALDPSLKAEVVNFIDSSKRLTGLALPHDEDVDIALLNDEQKRAFDFVQRHFQNASDLSEPLRLIIQGSAGTGKSFLIRALMVLLNGSAEHKSETPVAVLLAPTGVAAHLVNGYTIQSYLAIPPRSNQMKSKKGEAAKRFQKKFSRTRYILVEERSMVGCRLFCALDARLKEAFPSKADVPFGGLSVILIGDHFQLPPVADYELFLNQNCSCGVAARQNAYMLYMMFNRGIVLNIQQRQIGSDPAVVRFRELLSRLKYGLSTREDWELLMTRVLSRLVPEEQHRFRSAIRLYATKKESAAFNEKVLRDSGSPVARIAAVHAGPGAETSDADEARGLEPVIYLSLGCRVMLKLNLWTAQGLVNGATGEVQEMFYKEGDAPTALPVAVLVKFDNYTGPCLRGYHNCVSIEPVKRTWKSLDEKQHCSRTQIPLARADAVTIHSAQGRTITTGVVVNIGKKDFAPGLSFVAFSRVPSLSDMALDDVFDFNRLAVLGFGASTRSRVAEEERIQSMQLTTAQVTDLAAASVDQPVCALIRQFSQLSPVKNAQPAKRRRPNDDGESLPEVEINSRSVTRLTVPAIQNRREISIRGDGHCLYRAIALVVYRDQERHLDVRAELLELMTHNRDFYVNAYSPEEMDDDFQFMASGLNGVTDVREYGGYPQIVAAGELYNLHFNIFTDTGLHHQAGVGNAGGTVNLLFYEQGRHYNLLE